MTPCGEAAVRVGYRGRFFQRGDRLAGYTHDEGTASGCPVHGEALSILPGRSVKRWLYLLAGLLSVAVGFIGVFLPGLPTTVFLILASYCFTRSCPWLEDRLVRAPVFRPYLQYLDGERAMPFRARLTTVAMIWGATSISLLMVRSRGAIPPWFAVAILSAAAIGSIVVMLIFRGGTSPDDEPA
jgi:uncharacterized membrane protein YbaN (DUF454 family)